MNVKTRLRLLVTGALMVQAVTMPEGLGNELGGPLPATPAPSSTVPGAAHDSVDVSGSGALIKTEVGPDVPAGTSTKSQGALTEQEIDSLLTPRGAARAGKSYSNLESFMNASGGGSCLSAEAIPHTTADDSDAGVAIQSGVDCTITPIARNLNALIYGQAEIQVKEPSKVCEVHTPMGNVSVARGATCSVSLRNGVLRVHAKDGNSGEQVVVDLHPGETGGNAVALKPGFELIVGTQPLGIGDLTPNGSGPRLSGRIADGIGDPKLDGHVAIAQVSATGGTALPGKTLSGSPPAPSLVKPDTPAIVRVPPPGTMVTQSVQGPDGKTIPVFLPVDTDLGWSDYGCHNYVFEQMTGGKSDKMLGWNDITAKLNENHYTQRTIAASERAQAGFVMPANLPDGTVVQAGVNHAGIVRGGIVYNYTKPVPQASINQGLIHKTDLAGFLAATKPSLDPGTGWVAWTTPYAGNDLEIWAPPSK